MGKYALIIVSGFVITFGFTRSNINRMNASLFDSFYQRYEQANVRNIANGAAQVAIRELVDDSDWRTGWNSQSLFDGTSTVVVEDSSNDSTLGRGVIRITSTATYENVTDTTVVVWKRKAFSEFSYFTNNEPTIYFITGDTLNGPVHTNGTFHMSGSPVFNGKVSSPNLWVGSGTPKFFGGADFNVSTVSLPINLDQLTAAAQSGGVVVSPASTKSLWLDFQSDGTVNYVVLNDGSSPTGGTSWTNFDLTSINGVIGCTEEVHVKGTVNGQITVGSAKDIYLEDDILYAADPRSGTSDDLLGLVSKQKVIVAENTANNSNCEIHASILALDKFTVQNYSSGSPRGTLIVLGGIVQETRGAVGTFGGGGISSGYSKNYQYDERLIEEIPPFYPIVGEDTGGNPYAPGRVLSWYE